MCSRRTAATSTQLESLHRNGSGGYVSLNIQDLRGRSCVDSEKEKAKYKNLLDPEACRLSSIFFSDLIDLIARVFSRSRGGRRDEYYIPKYTEDV